MNFLVGISRFFKVIPKRFVDDAKYLFLKNPSDLYVLYNEDTFSELIVGPALKIDELADDDCGCEIRVDNWLRSTFRARGSV